MNVYVSDDVLAVTGLDWDTTTPAEWKKRKKTLRSEGLVTASLQVLDPQSSDNVINFGSIAKDASELSGSDAKASLAGLLALSLKDGHVIAVERLPGELDDDTDNYWFCAINNGQVISGTDIVGEYAVIQAAVQDHRDLFGGDVIRIVGNAADTEEPDAPTDSVLHYIDDALVSQALLVRKRSSKGFAWILIAGITTAIVGGASVVMFTGKSEPVRPQMTPEQILQQQQDIARAQLAEKESEVLSAMELGSHLAHLIHETVGALPAKVGGWQLISTACQNNSCISDYSNSDLTPPGMLEDATNDSCATLIMGSMGERASCVSIADSNAVSDHPNVRNRKLTKQDERKLLDSFMDMARTFPGDVAYRKGDGQPIAFPGRESLASEELFGLGEFTLQIRSELTNLVLLKIYNEKPLIMESVTFNWSENITEIEGRFISVGESE